jgi:hypothetical protein
VPVATRLCWQRFFYNEESPGVIPGFPPESSTVTVLEKFRLVLPSPLVACVFVDRLFLSAAEGPFFDRFFLWFGSHRAVTYNNLNKISPILFYEHACRLG